MTFETAATASLDAFLSVSSGSRYQPDLREYTESLLGQRCTRPEWCVFGVAADMPVARAAFWALPDSPVPTDLVVIEANWDEPALSGAHELLTHMHELARGLGAGGLRHHVDAPPGPPQFQENDSARIRLLTEAGYELDRDGLRWLFTAGAAQSPVREPALGFRDLTESGDEAFVEALAATYEGTRDSILTRHVEERGLLEASRSDFLDYKELEYVPEWWELAYAEDGALAGVVMPARNPSSAVIGYVGVVPGQRGKGVGAALVRRGTDALIAGGAREVRGDCDRENVAMVKSFERAGYEQIARRRTYQRSLVDKAVKADYALP
jgi:ribosomal protein S18 acetylase RimI-like enzyme